MSTQEQDRMRGLARVLSRVTGLSAAELASRSGLVSDGLLDSLKIVELYFEIETLFGASVSLLTPVDFESLNGLMRKLCSEGVPAPGELPTDESRASSPESAGRI